MRVSCLCITLAEQQVCGSLAPSRSPLINTQVFLWWSSTIIALIFLKTRFAKAKTLATGTKASRKKKKNEGA